MKEPTRPTPPRKTTPTTLCVPMGEGDSLTYVLDEVKEKCKAWGMPFNPDEWDVVVNDEGYGDVEVFLTTEVDAEVANYSELYEVYLEKLALYEARMVEYTRKMAEEEEARERKLLEELKKKYES